MRVKVTATFTKEFFIEDYVEGIGMEREYANRYAVSFHADTFNILSVEPVKSPRTTGNRLARISPLDLQMMRANAVYDIVFTDGSMISNVIFGSHVGTQIMLVYDPEAGMKEIEIATGHVHMVIEGGH